jgi:hypothetical protein
MSTNLSNLEIIDVPAHDTRPGIHDTDADAEVIDVIDLNQQAEPHSGEAAVQAIALHQFLAEFGDGLLDRVREQTLPFTRASPGRAGTASLPSCCESHLTPRPTP